MNSLFLLSFFHCHELPMDVWPNFFVVCTSVLYSTLSTIYSLSFSLSLRSWRMIAIELQSLIQKLSTKMKCLLLPWSSRTLHLPQTHKQIFCCFELLFFLCNRWLVRQGLVTGKSCFYASHHSWQKMIMSPNPVNSKPDTLFQGIALSIATNFSVSEGSA